MNKLVKDALILTAITLIAGLALGIVYEITKAPIASAKAAATQAAYQTVFADATTFEDLEGFDSEAATAVVAEYPNNTIDNCVVAKDSAGNALGYVITVTSSAGYGGKITFSVGITNEGVLNGYSITTISETAGLGMKATVEPDMSLEASKDKSFARQFVDKAITAFEVTKTGSTSDSEINAISGATITSKAMTYGVDAAIVYFNSLVGGASNE